MLKVRGMVIFGENSRLVKKIMSPRPRIQSKNIFEGTLALAVLAVVFILIGYLQPDWQFRGDGFGYYNYLRSIFWDGDLNFANEQQFYKEYFGLTEETFYDRLTDTGMHPNPFAVGTAIFRLPFFLPVFGLSKLMDFSEPFRLAGLSPPFQVAMNLANIVFGTIGVIFVFKLLRQYFSPELSWLVAFLSFAATPLVYYMTYEAGVSHAVSFFAAAWFLYYFFKKRSDYNYRFFLFCGSLFGLVGLARWQNFLFGTVFAALFWRVKDRKKLILGYLISLGSALFVFMPQMISWKIIYGHWITIPESNTHIDFLHPSLIEFLFSARMGFFVYTPIFILAAAGFFFLRGKRKWLLWMLIPLGSQICVNASLSDWYGGAFWGAFGARRMIASIPILMVGLAALYSSARKNISRPFWAYLVIFGTGMFFICLNISLLAQKGRGMIKEGFIWSQWVGNWIVWGWW